MEVRAAELIVISAESIVIANEFLSSKTGIVPRCVGANLPLRWFTYKMTASSGCRLTRRISMRVSAERCSAPAPVAACQRIATRITASRQDMIFPPSTAADEQSNHRVAIVRFYKVAFHTNLLEPTEALRMR